LPRLEICQSKQSNLTHLPINQEFVVKKFGFWIVVVSSGVLLLTQLTTESESPAQAAPPKKFEPKTKPGNIFMRSKLKASQEILEGLTTEDFELVAKGAKELNTMTQGEKWRVSNDVMYKQFSQEFQRKTAALEKSAKGGQVNDISLKWVSVTMSCIECHSYVRGNRISEARENNPVFAHSKNNWKGEQR